ncbi:MAG TPA: cytidine deaminase [Terriglobales bacterium]|nr:cytidine deaminase [Terriglobales bacterium]
MKVPAIGADASEKDLLTTALGKFSEKSRTRLLRVVTAAGFDGRIPAAEVAAARETEGQDEDVVMLGLLPLARIYSHSPISKYQVGAAVRGFSGDLYLGTNIEFPGHSLGFSLHGEQSALSNAYMHMEQGISAIVVTAAPCGHCRQFLNELSPDIQVLVDGKPAAKLSTLLPSAFGPKDLGVTESAFPAKEANLGLRNGASDQLTRAALDAARKSYAPYTKAHSGVAVGTRSGRIFRGAYIENAAYNPSLPPLQAALSALILAGGSFSDISKVLLVETEGAPISQRSVAEPILSVIATRVKLETLVAQLS